MPTLPTPEPEPSSLPKPKPSSPRWPWISLGVLAVAGAAVWLGDVPNRYRASQWGKTAQISLLSSDFPRALRAYREALLLRPMDFDLQRQYTDTQTRWLQIFEREFEGKTPERAYAQLHTAPAQIETLLTEPQLGTYRKRVETVTNTLREQLGKQLEDAKRLSADNNFEEAYAALKPLAAYPELVPDLAARRREIEVAQVNAAMAEAQESFDRKAFTDAREKLEAVQSLAAGVPEFTERLAKSRQAERDAIVATAKKAANANPPDFDAAWAAYNDAVKHDLPKDEATKLSTMIGQAALDFYGFDLVRAIATRSEDEVRKNLKLLNQHAKLATTEIDPAVLTGETLEFEPFVATLKKLHIGSNGDEEGYRVDVHLIYTALPRFKDPAPAKKYLADAFMRWSQIHAKKGRSAIADALYRRAVEQGATEDPAWHQTQIAALRTTHALTLVMATPEHVYGGLEAKPLAQATYEAMSAKLSQGDNGWPKLVWSEAETEGKDAKLKIALTCHGGVDDNDEQTKVARSVRYQSGTRTVTNDERKNIVQEHNELMRRYKTVAQEVENLDYQSKSAQNNPNLTPEQRTAEVTSAELSALTRKWEMNNLNQQIADLRARGDAMPRTVEEPVYANEPYSEITHHHTFEATWSVRAEWQGAAITEDRSVTARARRQTSEVRGNAAHGVPVKPETRIDRTKLGTELTLLLVKEIKGGNWFDLPEFTWAYALARNSKESVADVDSIERALGIALLWEERGVKIAGLAVAQQALEQLLLPPVEPQSGAEKKS